MPPFAKELQVVNRKLKYFFAFGAAWALSIGTALIGGLISVFSSEIKEATTLSCKFIFSCGRIETGGIHFYVTGFWLVVGIWAVFLFFHLKGQRDEQLNETLHILRTIHRIPNLNLLRSYKSFYFKTAAEILDVPLPPESEKIEERITEIEERLKAGLIIIAKMASEFARASEEVHYSANIMLIVNPTDFCDEIVKCLHFHEKTNISALSGILYLPKGLIAHHNGNLGTDVTPLISLPVPSSQYHASGVKMVLPGAPEALVSGNMSVYEDCSSLHKECKDFSAIIRHDIQTYFSNTGEGKNIKSLVSLRIGYEGGDPIGVLNIDSDSPNVLGTDSEFYQTFETFVTPIVHLLQKHVSEYASLIWPILAKRKP